MLPACSGLLDAREGKVLWQQNRNEQNGMLNHIHWEKAHIIGESGASLHRSTEMTHAISLSAHFLSSAHKKEGTFFFSFPLLFI